MNLSTFTKETSLEVNGECETLSILRYRKVKNTKELKSKGIIGKIAKTKKKNIGDNY